MRHVLRQVPLFERIGKRHLRLLAGRCQVMRYRPGEPIVRADFSGEGFFTIASGRASVQRSDGHEVILAQGDFFGDLSLIDGASRNATVVAETDLIALKLTRQTFLDLLDAEPTVCRALVESLVERIRAIKAHCPPDGAAHSSRTARCSLQLQPRFTNAAARAPYGPRWTQALSHLRPGWAARPGLEASPAATGAAGGPPKASREATMHARVSTYQASDPEGLMEGFRSVSDSLEATDGFSHAYLMVDRDSGKAMSITIWDSEAALMTSVSQADELRERATSPARPPSSPFSTRDPGDGRNSGSRLAASRHPVPWLRANRL